MSTPKTSRSRISLKLMHRSRDKRTLRSYSSASRGTSAEAWRCYYNHTWMHWWGPRTWRSPGHTRKIRKGYAFFHQRLWRECAGFGQWSCFPWRPWWVSDCKRHWSLFVMWAPHGSIYRQGGLLLHALLFSLALIIDLSSRYTSDTSPIGES